MKCVNVQTMIFQWGIFSISVNMFARVAFADFSFLSPAIVVNGSAETFTVVT